jgi:hypothetical protein
MRSRGLICGHAYSITALKKIELPVRHVVEEVRLLRIENPWGSEIEWNGDWSDE